MGITLATNLLIRRGYLVTRGSRPGLSLSVRLIADSRKRGQGRPRHTFLKPDFLPGRRLRTTLSTHYSCAPACRPGFR